MSGAGSCSGLYGIQIKLVFFISKSKSAGPANNICCSLYKNKRNF